MSQALAEGPEPTGRPTYVDGVPALRFERTLEATADEVWELLTDPRRARDWLGEWELDLETGTLDVRTMAEVGAGEPVRYRLVDVVAGRGAELVTVVGEGEEPWRMRMEIEPEGDRCRLVAVETVPQAAFLPLVGAAGDFHLDRLTSLVAGTAMPRLTYDDYVVSQTGHYRALFPAQRRGGLSGRTAC